MCKIFLLPVLYTDYPALNTSWYENHKPTVQNVLIRLLLARTTKITKNNGIVCSAWSNRFQWLGSLKENKRKVKKNRPCVSGSWLFYSKLVCVRSSKDDSGTNRWTPEESVTEKREKSSEQIGEKLEEKLSLLRETLKNEVKSGQSLVQNKMDILSTDEVKIVFSVLWIKRFKLLLNLGLKTWSFIALLKIMQKFWLRQLVKFHLISTRNLWWETAVVQGSCGTVRLVQ